jgi:signal transduction histidine kinase
MATRILIVDDNPQDRVLARRALAAEFSDLSVVEVRNQTELDAALADGKFDVVVTDYQLRWTDGLKVLAAVHGADATLPVVMFTNTGSEEVAASGLRMGLADYIVKSPAHFGRLAHGVRTALSNADVKRRERDLIRRERDALRVAEQTNRLKDEFLATVSHELRNPLNAIRGWVQVLQTSPDRDTVIRATRALGRNTEALARLIEDLVDESAINAGKLRLRMEVVDFDAALTAAVDSLRLAALGKRLDLAVTIAPDLPPVAADPSRLQQVVANLLLNAIKFTPDGGRIELGLNRAGSTIELTISDTGQGIRADYLPHIFDRFSQQDGATTRGHDGLGLGLSIARHIVELHGGTIQAASAGEGHGATFTVQLPVAAALVAEERDSSRYKRLHGVRVLVVDNDVEARDILGQILGDVGAVVTTAASAAEAFAIIRTARPDVLVCDIGMPVEDGYSLIQRIRSDSDLTLASLPAAALTAYASTHDRLRALEAGFQFHLTKPVTIASLTGTVGVLASRADWPIPPTDPDVG